MHLGGNNHALRGQDGARTPRAEELRCGPTGASVRNPRKERNPKASSIYVRLRHAPRVLSVVIGIFQNPLRRHQIGCVETFCEPIVDRLQADDGLGVTALIAQQAGEACGGSQLPRQCLLLVRKIERLPEEVLRRFSGGRSSL